MAGKVVVLLFPLLVLVGASVPATASLHAFLESPGNGPVSGVDVIRGWIFSETAGVSPAKTELWIDGGYVTTIPCCGERVTYKRHFHSFLPLTRSTAASG